jgi:large subunit ribosomal protein L24
MKQGWVSSWKSSKQPRKQRKYRYNAPVHVRRKFLSGHLSKELRTRYNRRSIPLRSGDKVKVLRGSHKGHTGKVDRLDIKNTKVFVTGIEIIKKDGSKVTPSISPSNLMVTELRLGDKKREASLARGKSLTRPTTKPVQKEVPKEAKQETSP